MEILFWVTAILLVYAYIIYPVLLFFFDKVFRSPKLDMGSELPKVSLIIAAYNEEKVIETRIQNCLELNYPKDRLEIIIASDGSNDRTNEIVSKYGKDGVVLLAYPRRRGKVNVLNDAVSEAKNEIIVFSDANSLFKLDALENLVRCFADPRVGCVCGLLKFLNLQGSESSELEGFYWQYETFLKKIEGGRGSLLGANGAIYAIRKVLFSRCPVDTIVEDFYIPIKILEKGYKVYFEQAAVAIEDTATRIIQEKRRRIRIGAGDYQALVRLLPMLNPLKGFSSFAFWSHKVLRWLVPFLLVGLFVSNLFLLSDFEYRVALVLQGIFYMAALMGQFLSWASINIKPLKLCYYFVSMNLALLLGFIRYVTGRQSVAWERTER